MDMESNLQRGEALFMDGLLDQAEAVFQEILRFQLDHYEALNNLGVISHNRGLIEEAEHFFLKALDVNGEYLEALSNLADLYQAANQREKAADCMEKLLVFQANDHSLLNRLAFLYIEMNRKERAAELIKNSLRICPEQEALKETAEWLKGQSHGDIRTDYPGEEHTPLVSVGLPVYNGGKYLAEARKAMRFSICSIEPDGFKFAHFLYDICKYLCFAIESAGHEICIVRNHLSSDRINIIVGSHRLNSPSNVEAITRAGKYILLQSEIITGSSINNWNNQKSYAEVQMPLMRQAQTIWTGADSKNSLKQIGIDSEILLLGYHPAMEEVVHKQKKDIDFLFYGSLTPHRQKMIQELRRRGGNVLCVFDEAAMYRNDLIARTRVHLAPKQGPEMDHFCGSRILYLLNNRSIVVVERCREQEMFEHCFPYADTEQWVDLCMETLRRPDLEQVTNEYYERFKKIRMVDLVRPLIERLR
jgi:hypothetical protein